MIRELQAEKIDEGVTSGLIETGNGLNQELSLQKAGDTRWGSHYKTLGSLVALFSPIMEVLQTVSREVKDSTKQAQARGLLRKLRSFDFVFNLHMMLTILGITNELSIALQKKYGDILNAMGLVKVAKLRLQELRDDGWDSLLSTVSVFCNENKFDGVDMKDEYVDPDHPRRKSGISYEFHYKFNFFYYILDQQLSELNDRFNEVNSELLTCVASLNPIGGFADFNKAKLVRLAKFYPNDFSLAECIVLDNQLETYIRDVRSDDRFGNLKGLSDLSRLLVVTRKDSLSPLMYRLLKLALTLPVATATVERCFSAMKIMKTDLRNRLSYSFLNDCLVCFIERDLLKKITDDVVIKRFQSMKMRREQL